MITPKIVSVHGVNTPPKVPNPGKFGLGSFERLVGEEFELDASTELAEELIECLGGGSGRLQ